MNVQMNVRIDDQLKAEGDAVFAAAGLSPSQVVRRVWEFAVRHRKAPEFVLSALQSSPNALAELEREHELREIAEESCVMGRIREQFAIPHPDSLDVLDYKALYDQALNERMIERGLA